MRYVDEGLEALEGWQQASVHRPPHFYARGRTSAELWALPLLDHAAAYDGISR